jgi:hypothetical protein
VGVETPLASALTGAVMPAGYSGTPLAKKLGLRSGMHVCVIDAPRDYRTLATPWPDDVRLDERPSAQTDLVHLFVTQRVLLAHELKALRKTLKPNAVLWISWPKKAAKVTTDITEDVIREVALPLGWVDAKVCAVDEIWSGLKLVVRKKLRE